jgi:DNA-binding transcriptional ArsR family regulator
MPRRELVAPRPSWSNEPRSRQPRRVNKVPSRPAPDRDVLEGAAKVFRLLSGPGRLQLLWILSNDEVDVTRLVAAVGRTKAGISQHLAKLDLAGWINRRREGRRILYRVVDSHIVTLVHQGVRACPGRTCCTSNQIGLTLAKRRASATGSSGGSIRSLRLGLQRVLGEPWDPTA